MRSILLGMLPVAALLALMGCDCDGAGTPDDDDPPSHEEETEAPVPIPEMAAFAVYTDDETTLVPVDGSEVVVADGIWVATIAHLPRSAALCKISF